MGPIQAKVIGKLLVLVHLRFLICNSPVQFTFTKSQSNQYIDGMLRPNIPGWQPCGAYITMGLSCSAYFDFTMLASGVPPWLRKSPHDLPRKCMYSMDFHGVFGLTSRGTPWPLPVMARMAWFLAFASRQSAMHHRNQGNRQKKMLLTGKHDETPSDFEAQMLC